MSHLQPWNRRYLGMVCALADRQRPLNLPPSHLESQRPTWTSSWRQVTCVRLRPTHRNHVWAYDFMAARTHNGRPFRILTILDEHTREGLATKVARRIRSDDVLESLVDLFVERGVPDYIRADNRPEFTARAVRDWLARVGAQTLFIEPGGPWENGYVESFNGKLRDELLDREIFYTLKRPRC